MARKLAAITAATVLAAAGAFAWTFTAAPLPLPQEPGPVLPAAPAQRVQLAVVETGSMESNALFAYRGGSLEKRLFGMDVFVIRHPQGTILFEAGFGSHLAEHFQTVPRLMRSVSKVHPAQLLTEQLAAAGIAPASLKGIFITHAHWDHVGALPDLPGVPVYVNPAERDFIEQGGEATTLARSFGIDRFQLYAFEGPAYAGFPASHDVFGDGSVVLVPAGGHTPGAVIAFLRGADRDYALIGDLAWQKEGVDIPAEKPWMSRNMVDSDPEALRGVLVKLHQLQQANPGLLIVPSHDRRVTSQLPRLAALAAS
jgi:N-acyl homoserine lactone hydrolase